ncbi:MAG: sugar ABC transporter ATP-binding protein, partial [Gemmataceae bacterium]
MAALVELVGVGKTFPGVVALRGVDLTIQAGRVHALLGENGAGKSTLLNLLAGLLQPDEGQIRIDGQPVVLRDARAAWAAGIVTVHQEVDLFPDLTVTENIAWQHGRAAGWLGIDSAAEHRQAAEALSSVGASVTPDDQGQSLTPAQRQMVEIAGAVSRAARVLILDEPTSSLSAAESERLFAQVRRFRAEGVAIVYVSHRFEEVFALADEITVLRDGRKVWTGNTDEITPEGLIRHMVGREVVATRTATAAPGSVRLACRNLSAIDGSFRDISLEVRAGEVLGLYGLVGAGRTEWAQAVFGLRPVGGGELRVDGQPVFPRSSGQMAKQGIAYVPEDRLRQGLCRGLGIDLNAILASLRRLAPRGWLAARAERQAAQRVTDQLSVRHHALDQPIVTLSGGNQQKVVVGRWLLRDPAVLLLDEPTRGVDVGARGEIYALVRRLADEGRAVVLISSDLPEVMSQSDRIGVFRGGRLVETLDARTATAEKIAGLALPGTESAFTTETRKHERRRSFPAELGLALFV